MEYIPQQPTPPPAPQPTYELKKDISGEVPIVRGPQVLKGFKGNSFKVPYPPKANCKKCLGRGYLGYNDKTGEIMPCRKCYPLR